MSSSSYLKTHLLNSSPAAKSQNPRPSSLRRHPQLNLLQQMTSAALDFAEETLICKFLDKRKPLAETSDPAVQIAGNFSPVEELPVSHHLPVSGQIPGSLNGVYVRNGANPLLPPAAGHHLFDGDGMIHAVKLKGGASYACRFTETERLLREKSARKPLYPKAIGELHGHSGIARLILFHARSLFKIVDVSKGTGTANAGLIFFNSRLLAMSEDDLPYHVKITDEGDLETVNRFDFDGQLRSAMIAHPKLDPNSKELFSLSYNVIQKPYLKYFWFSATGEKSADVEIPIEKPTMVHDFAITESFVVIPDQQMVFDVEKMLRGESPVIFDGKKVSRFGILPRYAETSSEIKWVDVPNCFCFHFWNAWEEPITGEIIVIGSCMTPPEKLFNGSSKERLKSTLTEIRLNPSTGTYSRREIAKALTLEAGMVNPRKLGRKTKYAYLAIAEPWPRVSGFAKVDLSTGNVREFLYGEGKYGGEPCFVPSESEAEDEGYVITFMHDERTSKSELLIVNTETMGLEASVKLPSRVPYGFHGKFISSKELESQA